MAVVKIRANLTRRFTEGAHLQADLARKIEGRTTITEEAKALHLSHVTAAIMQAVAALETEAWSILRYGPGHHLGSDYLDRTGKALLEPLADVIDRQGVLERYDLMLHLLGKTRFEKGASPWQDADLAVRLRNEIVHYKSRWDDELSRKSLMKALKELPHKPASFTPAGHAFFPYRCLNADCAEWSARSCAVFLEDFFKRLGMASPL